VRDRVVRNPKTGELFIETDPGMVWAVRHRRWVADRTQPCPMPRDHLMFRSPQAYGMELVEWQRDEQLSLLSVLQAGEG